MDFNNIDDIKQAGFSGFSRIENLSMTHAFIPAMKGVYMVVRLENNKPDFLVTGTGGSFKDKNNNSSIIELRKNWVEGTKVLYIGRAGGENTVATLRTKIRQYLAYGKGNKTGHLSGKLIWQLKDSKNLCICWKPMQNEDPKELEEKLIAEFVEVYGKTPFANEESKVKAAAKESAAAKATDNGSEKEVSVLEKQENNSQDAAE